MDFDENPTNALTVQNENTEFLCVTAKEKNVCDD